ncbi:AAA family ATPase [Halomonas cupida]|uniref:AAA family ATPase n=1 Tax=Halomonas cupida TaxID=44933 RepID=UPI0039B5B927
MKILALRLSQLASLPGPVEVDFRASPLGDAGLFAITGPTGAGKSTLLDALCLALFGNTPRLRHAPGRESPILDVDGSELQTADPRTLLRRGASSGHAEVDFIGRNGQRYRARWEVRRARNRADGKLQAVAQSLTNLDEDRLLTAQKREFAELLPQHLGLTFDQFTRAVLLAQSEFAAFLKADDNERADLLEKLTDTHEYSQISAAAWKRTSVARDEVKRLETQLADDLPADAQTRQQLDSELEQAEQTLAEHHRLAQQLDAEQRWLEQDQQLREAVDEAIQLQHQAHNDWQALAGERHDAEWLTLLAPQRDRLTRLEELKQRCPEQRDQLAGSHQQSRQADTALQQAETLDQQAQQQLDSHQQAIAQARPAIAQARELATTLTAQQHRLAALQDEHNQRQQQLTALGEQHQQCQARHQQHLAEREARQAELTTWLGDHQDVDSARQQAQQQLEASSRRGLALAELAQHWHNVSEASSRHVQLLERQSRDTAERDQCLTRGKEARQRLDDATVSLRHVTQFVQRQQAARSESIMELRAALDEETPCPVCGSLDHPWRESPPATPEAAQLAASQAEEERQLKEAQQAVDKAREQRDSLLGRYQALDAQLNEIQSSLEELAQQRDKASQHLDAHELYPELRAIVDAERSAWLQQQREASEQQRQQADERHKALDRAQQALTPLAEALARDERELERFATREQSLSEELQRLAQQSAPLQQQVSELQQQLTAQLGDHTSADEWQQQLEQSRDLALQARDQARQNLSDARQHQQRLHQQCEHDQQRLEALEQELQQLSRNVEQWRTQHPELDDDTLTRLLQVDDTAHRALQQRITDALTRLQSTEVSLDERRRQWQQARASRFPDTPTEQLLSEERQQQVEQLRTSLAERQAQLKPDLEAAQSRRDSAWHAVRDDDRRRQRMAEGREHLDAAREQHQRWARINDLIGSSDGKVFRRIAQAWNLERLIDEANEHLAGLSRRYRLVRGGSALGLQIIDRDLADERRSVHSLSGGESFLVSLAMALGLASMASGELRIESLFIDEGFGSLDPQSLAMAMDALDGLQAQGRRVGVISHVQEMHERIPVQIRVLPTGNGESHVLVTDR